MAGAVASLVLVLGASVLVGQALASLAAGATHGRPQPLSWLAPAFGLAALLVVAGITIRLPGHAVTAAIALGVVVIASGVVLRGRVTGLGEGARPRRSRAARHGARGGDSLRARRLRRQPRRRPGQRRHGLAPDHRRPHRGPAGPRPLIRQGGYPIGPHALVAAIASVTGADLVDVFVGFTLALAPLLGLVALGGLTGLGRVRRILGACLVALAYLGIAYLMQGAFKEPMMSVLLLGGALALGSLIGLRPDGEAG